MRIKALYDRDGDGTPEELVVVVGFGVEKAANYFILFVDCNGVLGVENDLTKFKTLEQLC